MSRTGSCPISGCEEPAIHPIYGEIVSLTFHELAFFQILPYSLFGISASVILQQLKHCCKINEQ